MMTYTFILKGIEKMDFPKKITKRPEDLIRKLCRYKTAQREQQSKMEAEKFSNPPRSMCLLSR